MRRRGQLAAALLLLLTFSVGALSGMAAEEAFGLDWFDFLDEDRGRQAGEDEKEGRRLHVRNPWQKLEEPDRVHE